MDDLVSVPVVKPSTFLAMKQEAKASLTQDMNLDKAADLAAQRHALLINPSIPDGLKKAQLKQLNRKVAHWSKKVRQPFGEGSDVGGLGDDVTDVSPTQNMVKALIKTIKSPEAVPTVIPKAKRRPVDDLTPVATPPIRPAKKKAKQALGGYQDPGPSSPLSAPPDWLDPQEKRKSSVAKGKQLAKKYLKKKGKQVAKEAAKETVKSGWIFKHASQTKTSSPKKTSTARWQVGSPKSLVQDGN